MTRAIVLSSSAALALLLASASLPLVAQEEKPADPEDAKAAKEAHERAVATQFAQLDRNSDGALRAAEIPEKFADRFDRNGDGAITRSEFLEVSTRPQGLRRLHPMRDARARAQEAMQGFDQDKNGSVARDEYPGADYVFRAADRSRDGVLSFPELLALAQDELEDIRRRMKSPTRNEFLNLFDLRSDGRVSADEYDGPAAPFRKFDADGDGVVTYDELYPERMARREYEAPKPTDTNAVSRLDTDGDGKVGRAEFAGTDAAWRRMDRNGDGYITVADAR